MAGPTRESATEDAAGFRVDEVELRGVDHRGELVAGTGVEPRVAARDHLHPRDGGEDEGLRPKRPDDFRRDPNIGHHLHVEYCSFAAALGSLGVRDRERQVREEMLELLAFIGLAEFEAMPASELSVGQRRLLALGRAMAMRPCLLLLDEPAAGLSPVNVDNLLRIILGLKDRYGLKVVIVEHILRVVMDTCGIVTVLDHGQKIAEGTPDEVKNDHAVIEAYLGREMGDEKVRAALEA